MAKMTGRPKSGGPVEVRAELQLNGNYLVETCTKYFTGTLVGYSADWIMLRSAAWIADTGRYSDALKTGSLNEVEPMPDVVLIARSAVVSVTAWNHPLPTEKK